MSENLVQEDPDVSKTMPQEDPNNRKKSLKEKASVRVTCPACNKEVLTNVKKSPGTLTYISCCCMCCVFFPLSCLPFCINSCLDTIHYCPTCLQPISRAGFML